MEFSLTCRTCLNTNNYLHPIFKEQQDSESISSDIYESTGILIKPDDRLPQKMCMKCISQIQATLNFRKTCKRVQTVLLEMKDKIALTETHVIHNIQEDILISSTNNNSSHLINTPENMSIYNNSKALQPENIVKIEFVDTLNMKRELDFDDELPLNLYSNSNNYGLLNKEKLTAETTDIKINEVGTKHSKSQKTNCSILKIENDSVAINQNNLLNDNNLEQLKFNTDLNLKQFCNGNKKCLDVNKLSRKFYMFSISNVNTDLDLLYTIVNPESKSSKVICKLCNKVLSIRSWVVHMERRHPGADTRKVKCTYCEKYILKERMKRHVTISHSTVDGNMKCAYCKEEFIIKEDLIHHVSTCTSKKRRRLNDSGRELTECDVCHKKMQKASLKMHIAVKHTGLRPVCEHCGKSFGNKFRLSEHFRAKHDYEKFQCQHCDFQSASTMALKNHERRHRGEKPFVCEICGSKFHAAYLLKQHKHSHRTEKLVKCDLCPASFKAKNSLHMHKLTCHSKSLYRCTLCFRTYKCRHYVLKHVRLAHNFSGAPPVAKVAVID